MESCVRPSVVDGGASTMKDTNADGDAYWLKTLSATNDVGAELEDSCRYSRVPGCGWVSGQGAATAPSVAARGPAAAAATTVAAGSAGAPKGELSACTLSSTKIGPVPAAAWDRTVATNGGAGARGGVAAPAAAMRAAAAAADSAPADGLAVGDFAAISPVSRTAVVSPKAGEAAACAIEVRPPAAASAATGERELLTTTRREGRRRSRNSSLSISRSGSEEGRRSSSSSRSGSSSSSSNNVAAVVCLEQVNGKKRSSKLASCSPALLLRRRFKCFARELVSGRGGQQCQYRKGSVCAAKPQQQHKDCSADQEPSAVVIVSDCDRSYVCAVDSERDDDSVGLSLSPAADAAGAEPATARAGTAFVFSMTAVCHAAAPAAAVTEEDVSRRSNSHSFLQGEMSEARSEFLQQPQQQRRGAAEDEQGGSYCQARGEESAVRGQVGSDASCGSSEPQRPALTPSGADARSRESLGRGMRRRTVAADRAEGREQRGGEVAAAPASDGGRVRFSSSGLSGAGGVPFRRGGSVFAAPSAAAGLTHESSRRQRPFVALLVLQLCLCGALLVTACVGFARLRDIRVEGENPGDAVGFPRSGGFSWARGSESLVQLMLLLPALLASACSLLKLCFCSVVVLPSGRRPASRWPRLPLFHECLHVLSGRLRRQRGHLDEQQDTTKNLLLPVHQEYSFLRTSTYGHGLRPRRSMIQHLPARHGHHTYHRNRRQEAAALACSLLLALCSTALLLPSVVVWDAFCHFSDRDWTQQQPLQMLPNYSLSESQQARQHAARLCDDRSIVLCCFFLAFLLSISELLLLWLHRKVATAAAVAAGAAAAAALAATMAYATPAFERRMPSIAPQRRTLQLSGAFLSASAAANNGNREEQQPQPHGCTGGDDLRHPAKRRASDAAGGRRQRPEYDGRGSAKLASPAGSSPSAASRREGASLGKYKPFCRCLGFSGKNHEGNLAGEAGKKRGLLVEGRQQQRQQKDPAAWQGKDIAAAGEGGDIGNTRGRGQGTCACCWASCSLWEAVLLLGYFKFLAGCVLVFAASLLLHEQSCYRSTHAFLRTQTLHAAARAAAEAGNPISLSSFETRYTLEGTLVLPVTVRQEVDLFFGTAAAGMMVIASVNIVCGAYGAVVGWKRSPLLSGLNVLLNAIIIWMEFAACVGLLFAAAGLNFFCNYTKYPVSQEPLPRFLASYVCNSSNPAFYVGWAAAGVSFLIVLCDLIVDFVLLFREVRGKRSQQVPGFAAALPE